MAGKSRRKSKQQKRTELSLLTLLVLTMALIASFIYLGKPQNKWSSQAEWADPSGLSQTYQSAFIDKMVPKSQSLQADYGVLPSIIISQAILESNWGRSELARVENNYFGIKDSKQGAYYPTLEYYDGWVSENEPFKVYASFEDSMEDHARLLAYGTSWNADHYRGVTEAANYQAAALALQEAGYATDPAYASKLITLIEKYQLYQYD